MEYNEADIVKVFRRMGLHCSRHEQNLLHKPEGIRRVGRPAVSCLESVEDILKKRGVRNWMRNSQGRGDRRAVVKQARFITGHSIRICLLSISRLLNNKIIRSF
jgi:hypothetical protein